MERRHYLNSYWNIAKNFRGEPESDRTLTTGNRKSKKSPWDRKGGDCALKEKGRKIRKNNWNISGKELGKKWEEGLQAQGAVLN